MGSGSSSPYRLANYLYGAAFPIYRPLYHAYKAITDHAERQLLAKEITPGAIVADVGANIGVYSHFLAKQVGPKGMVHSFEPSPANFARLRRSLTGIENVQLNEVAVADKTGTSHLYLSSDLNVDHRAYATSDEARQAILIQMLTLDDYFPANARVDLIKMDIQGFELRALHGARRVLRDNPGIKLVIEFWPYGLRQAGDSSEELLQFLRENDFQVFSFDKAGLRKFDLTETHDFDPSDYRDLFALRV